MKNFVKTAYSDLKDFVYGRALAPVKCKNGVEIGGGEVYPELNFTMPTMQINEGTMAEVIRQYRSIVDGACKRAAELHQPLITIEVELLPPTTYNPAWGVEITKNVLVMRTFRECAEAGADMLAIESIGGKDVHDDAVMVPALI